MRDPERGPKDSRQDRDDHVIPHQERVGGKGDEGLPDGVGNGAHEQEDGRDERAHVLGRFGEGVLEARDGGEDLREGDEEVGDRLDPDVDGRGAGAGFLGRVLAARAQFVNVVLGDAGGDHGGGGQGEPPGDLLQRREADAHAFEGRVDEDVADGDEDDESDGVDVVDEIVGGAVEFHGCGLGDEVVGHLVVGEPPDRVPQKDGASFETPTDFVNPDVVKGHPHRLVWPDFAWLHGFPEIICAHVFDAGSMVQVSLIQ